MTIAFRHACCMKSEWICHILDQGTSLVRWSMADIDPLVASVATSNSRGMLCIVCVSFLPPFAANARSDSCHALALLDPEHAIDVSCALAAPCPDCTCRSGLTLPTSVAPARLSFLRVRGVSFLACGGSPARSCTVGCPVCFMGAPPQAVLSSDAPDWPTPFIRRLPTPSSVY
jgi:hypothetical protein